MPSKDLLERSWWKANKDATADTMKDILSGDSASTMENSSGATPLHLACAFVQDVSTVRYLLECGSDVNKKTNTGWTPLFYASSNGGCGPQIMSVLVTAGANIHDKDKDGWSALMAAAINKSEANCRALINFGVDKNIKEKDGLTAADLAKKRNFPSIHKFITEHNRDELASPPAPSSTSEMFSPTIKTPSQNLSAPLQSSQTISTAKSVLDEVSRDDISETGSTTRPSLDAAFNLAEQSQLITRIELLEKDVASLKEQVGQGNRRFSMGSIGGTDGTADRVLMGTVLSMYSASILVADLDESFGIRSLLCDACSTIRYFHTSLWDWVLVFTGALANLACHVAEHMRASIHNFKGLLDNHVFSETFGLWVNDFMSQAKAIYEDVIQGLAEFSRSEESVRAEQVSSWF